MVFRTWFSGLEISTLGPGFSHCGFQDRNLKFFFIFIFRLKLPSSTDRVFLLSFCFLFFFRPKLLSSTNRGFFFFLSALNCRCRRIGFFFSLSVRPRLSVTTCSTLHPSDVGFFTSLNGENLATFTSYSIFKTFVPTYLPTYLPTKGDGFGVKEKKKRQARADCVRPSRAPTSLIY
jgi:hypothetical protein